MSDTPLASTSETKAIFHVDGDAFFVGVEIAKNPKLKGLPVVTGQERGIATALSYEAKALGVTRGMPVFQIKKNFPSVIILPGDYQSYVRYSDQMFEIVGRYAYGVEEYSIDECFADLTGLDRTLKMTYRQIAEKIKREITAELGISVSIGLAPTKVLAKVASSWVKPNGLTIIDKSNAAEFLAKVPIHKVWGIGAKTASKLMQKGVYTALDLSTKERAWVTHHFSKPYEVIWAELNSTPMLLVDVVRKNSFASIQKTRTFHPITNDKTFLWAQLSKHIEDACVKARHYNLVPKKFSIFLKTQDFKYVGRTATLLMPSNSPEIINSHAHKLFLDMHDEGLLYRTVGVTLSELFRNYSAQGDLFGDSREADKFDVIHKQIDVLEEKFGKRVVYLASTKQALKRKTLGTDSDDVGRDLLFL